MKKYDTYYHCRHCGWEYPEPNVGLANSCSDCGKPLYFTKMAVATYEYNKGKWNAAGPGVGPLLGPGTFSAI